MKEIRRRIPRDLDEQLKPFIDRYRENQKIKNKQVIATLVNKGDTETAKQYNITKQELESIKEKERFDKKKYPKVLLFDLETLPAKVRVWGLFKQRIPHDNIIQDWSILSWAGKWLYEPFVMGEILTPEEAINHDDKRILHGIWDLLEQADIVVAHNLLRFDNRKLKARFIANGFRPTTPYQTIDTLKAAQKEFGFTSHRLDYIGKLLTHRGKLETDFALWKKCDSGDAEALEYMLKYNKEDVLLLEECYLEIRPWIHGHPNLALHSHSTQTNCPYCESTELEEAGSYVTHAGRFNTIRCKNCGGISRRRKSDLTKTEKDALILSVSK